MYLRWRIRPAISTESVRQQRDEVVGRRVSDDQVRNFEPRLVPALERLSEQQRVVVVLVHGYAWSQAEVAELLGVVPSTIHTTLRRALTNLQHDLEVTTHDR